ncbi:unnamed protein product [Staurois parvus]|uniref:Uncharacterized protein n=1 Tax=Staurois parvus TaxID=386267 RepID=A0ABN9EJ76_9NEOB|nr:unnamed protein product [Staurois parvus]
MQGPGRPDIVNAGSWETRYSECRVRSHHCAICVQFQVRFLRLYCYLWRFPTISCNLQCNFHYILCM